MFRFHQAAAPIQDLIILGGGASSVCALVELIKELKKQPASPINITVLERTHTAGNGFPYDPQLNHPIMRVNNPNGGMIVDLDDKQDFVRWLQTHGDNLKFEFPDMAHIINANNNGTDLYAPRLLFGKYLQNKMRELIIHAEQFGIHIHLHTDVDVTDVMQDTDHHWYFKTENHGTYSAHNLLIAAGHLSSEKFAPLKSKPGYFNTPYTDLSNIADAPAFILGSGLSAIDAVKILAHQHSSAPIYMVSPSGQLPRVKGPLGDKRYQMKFLTRENLDKINIRLTEVMDLFTEEVKHAINNPRWNKDAVMRMARQENTHPARTLKREIEYVEKNQMRAWQLMLHSIWFEPLPLIWKNLHDDDRREFLSQYFSLYLKWSAGMTLASAKEMLALVETNQLQMIKCKDGVRFNEDTQQFEVNTADGAIITAKTVINAAGHGNDISGNPTLHAMAKRGLIRQEKYRGGVEIDDTSHVVDASGCAHSNAFAIGIITLGSNLDASSIEMCSHAAKDIAPLLAGKLLHSVTENAAQKRSELINLTPA